MDNRKRFGLIKTERLPAGFKVKSEQRMVGEFETRRRLELRLPTATMPSHSLTIKQKIDEYRARQKAFGQGLF